MDDTPPFGINDEALDIALGLGMMFNSSIVDEVHIARKQYLDGSIPTGFQRTAIYGLDGKIPYKDREIDIVQMSIEEDSCREHSDTGHHRVYIPDRLGMPLIETVTAPQMKTPQEVAEVCDIIRKALRSTGWVRTGAGASREDVNVSVTGGTRIEIKGVPSIKAIPLLTHEEAMRQWNLLRLKDELHRRGIKEDNFKSESLGVTRVLKNTSYQPIYNALKENYEVAAVLLRNFNNLLNWETQPNTRFSKEISDRVRVIACLTTLPNIIHSDSTETTISSAEWQQVKKAIKATSDDAVVLVWGSETDIQMAASEIAIRAKEATVGIPSETRQALADGTNGFERILPGADRMYPDTDLPPKKVTKERLEKIRAGLPKNYWKRERKYRELKIPEDVIVPLSISKYADLFEELVIKGLAPVFASVALIQFPKRLKRKGLEIAILDEKIIREIFDCYNSEVPKEAVLIVMERAIESLGFSGDLFPEPCSEQELRHTLTEAERELSRITLYKEENHVKVLMGIVMTRLRGRVKASVVDELINKDKVKYRVRTGK